MRSLFSLLLAVPDRGIRRWIASLVTASLILGVLVGIAATGATGISGSSSPAFADPPPSDPPNSIVLSSDKSTFTAGSWATLTATTDTDIGDTSSTVTITDETADDTVATCTSGTTCEATVSFNTGGPHTYVATVNDLTSNEVTVGRADWTVTLDSSATTFTVGESVTLTATANQDVGQTDYSYAIYIFDENTDHPVSVCNSGTTCSITSSALFLSGGPHTYVAEVDPYGTTSTYSSATDVQATSNQVPLSRAAWTVSLTSSETTFNAGDSITMTASANQDVGQTDYNYAIYIYDETSNQSVAFCTTGTTCSITTTNWFYSGGPHTYIAVIADPYIWSYSEATDVQAASNEVTLTRASWSVTLATSATSFSAGNAFTLTATANQDVGATSGGYFIYIYDETTGEYVQYCTSGTTCAYATTYYSGGPDQYVAEIAAGNYAYTMSELSDIQATSGDVTVSRDAWTVSLTTDRTVFTLAQGFTLTATTNQDVGNTNGSYWTYIVDATTGDIIDYCESGTVCSYSTVFGSGDPQTYVAVVAAGNESRADLTYLTLNEVQQSSNEVTETRAPWTISLSATTYETSPLALTFTAVANQPAGEGPYFIEIIDWTTGQEVGYCNPEERSPTCTDTVWPVADGGGEGDLFVAIVAFWSSTSGPGDDIQAISNGFTASSGSGAILSGESVGGSNPSENAPCGCSHGDPINTETGEFYLNATDLGIPGVGPALSVGRTYSSSLAGSDGPFGNGWSASFNAQLTTPVLGDADDPLPRQVQITQENGSTVDFYETPDQTYTAANRVLATLTNDPVSGDWTFTRRQTEVMVFNPTGQLIELQDLHGNMVSLSYNSSNQLDLISASGGRSITLTWTDNHVTNATDSAGRSVTYTYDDNSNLISVEAADSSITAYGYDSNHRLTTAVEPDDGITTNTYDSSGRVVSQTDPLDRETTFSYSDGGTTTTTTDPSGVETVEVYNNGLLVSSTKAASTDDAETTTYAYDSAANLASVTDPLGKVTSYTYDANGNILTQTDPLDRTTTWTYDGLNDVTSVTDPMSREALATYDTAGDKLTSTSPGGHVQHWTYNTDGTVATFEDARGHTTTYGYNSAGDQTSVTDPDDRTTSTAYDDAGSVTSTTDPGGNETTYTTDAAGGS